jgi:Fe-S oxidoreductase
MTGSTTLNTSKEFLNQVMAATTDGERIRLCLQCGACSGVCPFGFVMKFPPHGMIAALRAGMLDDLVGTDTGWMCVSCYACTQVCPAKIPVTAGLTTRVKEEMLLAGNVPSELQDALEKAQRYDNPLGESPRKRAEWASGLEPEVAIMAKAKRPVDVLWFVGDYASYHTRVTPSTRAMAKILQALDVDFGILGPEEVSDGDSVRLAGETGLFEMLAEKNAKAFDKYEFNEIITTDPHAFNAIKNEYPNLEISYPVRHYTQFLAERLDQLKNLMKNSIEATVVFHDPCYLGRVNEIFDEPRQLLQAIPGVELVEMSHNHENSLCCGGGGGGMWLDGFQWEKAEVRISEWRVREAISAVGRENGKDTDESRARILAVACPYEPPRFDDATKTVPGAEGLLVKDIAELLAESMGIKG